METAIVINAMTGDTYGVAPATTRAALMKNAQETIADTIALVDHYEILWICTTGMSEEAIRVRVANEVERLRSVTMSARREPTRLG